MAPEECGYRHWLKQWEQFILWEFASWDSNHLYFPPRPMQHQKEILGKAMNRKSPLILIWKVTHASNPTMVQVTKALMRVKGVSTCTFLTNLGKHFSVTVLLFSKHQIICSMIRSRETHTFVLMQMWRMQSRRWYDFTCPEVIGYTPCWDDPTFLPVFVQLLSHNTKAKHDCCLTATFPR